MATTQYIVKEGMRWDTVSYLAYGSSSFIQELIEANPIVPITPRLLAGTVLDVPVLDDGLIKTNKELLPPWKQ
jgi:hypothetical protein